MTPPLAAATADHVTGRVISDVPDTGAPGATATVTPVTSSATQTGPDLPELRFVRPLPGFGDLTRFVLVSLDADDAAGVLFELRSLEREEARFLVAPPAPFFPDYEVELDDDAVADLGLEGPDDALVLVVLTLGADGAHTTANLLAPVVVNARTRVAAQVILSGTEWPVRATVA